VIPYFLKDVYQEKPHSRLVRIEQYELFCVLYNTCQNVSVLQCSEYWTNILQFEQKSKKYTYRLLSLICDVLIKIYLVAIMVGAGLYLGCKTTYFNYRLLRSINDIETIIGLCIFLYVSFRISKVINNPKVNDVLTVHGRLLDSIMSSSSRRSLGYYGTSSRRSLQWATTFWM
jgi:hypothetical protein